MRIEISAGITGGASVAEYQLNMAGFISDVDAIISGFKAVTRKAEDLPGGVGSLQGAVEEIEQRITQEEKKRAASVNVRKKTNEFLELAMRVDKQVAHAVNKNRNEFYKTNPWLKPALYVDGIPWYEHTWDWLCDKGEKAAEGLKRAWTWTKDTAKKAWEGLKDFYQEHKKIIDTVLIVAGAIGAIVAVVATGGVALVPLLGALGVSTTAAVAISTAVAVVAVVSTVASSALNIVDTWMEIDDPTFNAWQKGLNITSAVSNVTYSVGTIYNSVKHIDPTDYIANQSPQNTQTATTVFDDTTPIAQDRLNGERSFAKGDHYDEFVDFWEGGGDGYTYTRADNPQTQYIRAKDVEGVYLNQSEVSNPSAFWNKRYSKVEYTNYVKNGGLNNNPIEVTKIGDSFYYFEGDGRHRLLVAQELDSDIPVIIKGFYTK